jgi:3-oxoadipate enol-lactonase
MMGSEQGFVPVEGGRLWYEAAGSGPPVVLVHGGLWDSRMWDDQFPALAERYSVVRYDLRGYGRSDRPSGPYSHIDDLAAVLAHAGIERAALVALSMGGAIAVDATIEQPELVSALVLAGTGLSGFDFSDDLERAYAPVEKALEAGDIQGAAELELDIWCPLRTDPEIDAHLRRMSIDNADQVALDPSLRRRLDPPAVERLGEISVPTLVVSGGADLPDMIRVAELIISRVPGARSAVLEGVDHAVNMRKPAEFTALVLDFLAAVF